MSASTSALMSYVARVSFALRAAMSALSTGPAGLVGKRQRRATGAGCTRKGRNEEKERTLAPGAARRELAHSEAVGLVEGIALMHETQDVYRTTISVPGLPAWYARPAGVAR